MYSNIIWFYFTTLRLNQSSRTDINFNMTLESIFIDFVVPKHLALSYDCHLNDDHDFVTDYYDYIIASRIPPGRGKHGSRWHGGIVTWWYRWMGHINGRLIAVSKQVDVAPSGIVESMDGGRKGHVARWPAPWPPRGEQHVLGHREDRKCRKLEGSTW